MAQFQTRALIERIAAIVTIVELEKNTKELKQ